MVTPVFETPHLAVYRLQLQRPGCDYGDKDAFVAMFSDGEWCGVVASCVVDPRQGTEFPAVVEWLETSTEWRRCGYAAELLDGIERFYGFEVEATPVTPEGEAFCDAMERRS